MSETNRRVFVLRVMAGSSAIAVPPLMAADAVPTEKLTETDPYAKSMGFKVDTKTVDKAKYVRHDPEQHCAKCQLFSGKPGEPLGPCSFFKRLVPVDGWCRNFKIKKA